MKFSLQKRVLKRPGVFHLSSTGDKTHQSKTLLVYCWLPSHSFLCYSSTKTALFHQGKTTPPPPKKLFTRQSHKVLDLLTISFSREALFCMAVKLCLNANALLQACFPNTFTTPINNVSQGGILHFQTIWAN